MSLVNKLRNLINTSPFTRRLFVGLLSQFSTFFLNLQSYSSINHIRQKRKTYLWQKTITMLEKLELKKIIIAKSSTSFFYQNGTAFNISKNRNSLSNMLVFHGNYELNETRLITKLIEPGWTVLDIGANFGWFSIHLSQLVGLNGKVLSFEPVPETYKELNENKDLNSSNNIKTYNIALGKSNGIVSFGIPEIDGGLAASSQFLNCKKNIQVTMHQLDDIIEDQNIKHVDFIKADIEGGELNMLYGAEKLLERFRPDIMIEIVDIHCHRFGYSPLDVYQFLTNKGYRGLFIGNEYTKKIKSDEINELIEPNASNIFNGNYFFSFKDVRKKLLKKIN